MSHHFDTKLAKQDPSLNLCDFYLFDGAPGMTVMAMTVNPDAGLSASDSLNTEGLYAFRLDLNGDTHEDVTFKFRFGEIRHAEGDEHVHVQPFQLRRASGKTASHGLGGDLLIEAETGKVQSKGGIRVYVGMAPELFAGDAHALHGFLEPFYKEGRYNGDTFKNRQNFFAGRNLTAIVLEVPNHLIGRGKIHAWATVSLLGHAPEVQVQRWGLPLITHLFLNDPSNQEIKDVFNSTHPSDDLRQFAGPIGDFAEKMSTYAGSAVNPAEYRKQVVARLCPVVLPYEIGTPAAFDLVGFNGRPLGDDVMDVMLTLSSNKPLEDGVAPDRTRIQAEFPYFGTPYTKDEQAGVTPVPRPAAK